MKNQNKAEEQLQVGSDSFLAAAALRWWEARRSQGFSVESHLRNPTLNCRDNLDDALAISVAKYVAFKKTRPPEKCPDCYGSGFEEIDHGHYPCRNGCLPTNELIRQEKEIKDLITVVKTIVD